MAPPPSHRSAGDGRQLASQRWRLYWTWRSKSRGGRLRLSPEVRELIAELWRSNRLWGSERIRSELKKLGIVVSNRSIRRYRWFRRPSDGTQQWRTFLINELTGIWAADLFTVQTLTMRTLYVLFFIAHDRRQTVHFKVTASPTSAWVWTQVIEATPWGQRPDYMIHDRDTVYGRDFEVKLAKLGVTAIRTPVRAPRANAIAERLVRSIHQECLDHVIVINERHVATLLKEYLAFLHRGAAASKPRTRHPGRPGPISDRGRHPETGPWRAAPRVRARSVTADQVLPSLSSAEDDPVRGAR